MSDSDPTFADWSIHLVPFLIISGIVITGFIITVTWLSAGAYAIPKGVEDTITTNQMFACFRAEELLTSQQLTIIDKNKFTTSQLNDCLSNSKDAYQLKLGDTTIKTENWDDNSAVDKQTLTPIKIIENSIISSTDLIIEVQHG